MTTKLCVALDSPDRRRILELADATEPHVDVFKIGLTAFIAQGPALVGDLAARLPVFLDLKLHDIPAQVEGAVAAAAGSGARFVTVHAAGGFDTIKAAVAAAGDELEVLAVTILTSLDARALEEIGLNGTPLDAVTRLAELALGAGAGGLVCSPLELGALRERFGPPDGGGPLLVVPGIRGPHDDPGDQRRTLGAAEAAAAGADMIVVGRSITAAPDPAGAAAELAAAIRRGRE